MTVLRKFLAATILGSVCLWGQAGGALSGVGNINNMATAVVTNTAVGATTTFTCPATATDAVAVWFKPTGTMGANITTSTVAGCSPGERVVVTLTQDATGGRTFAAPSGYTQPTINLDANATTTWVWQLDGTGGNGALVGGPYGNSNISASPETADPGSSDKNNIATQALCFFNSADHSGLECYANAGTGLFKMVLSGADINPVTGTVTKINNGSVPVSAHVLGSDSSSRPVAATATDDSTISYIVGAGTAQAQTATLVPAITSLTDGLRLCWRPAAQNTGAGPTLAVNGLTATTIVKSGGSALVAGDITTTAVACVIYDLSQTEFELQNPQTATSGATFNGQSSPGNVNVGAAAHSMTLNQGNGNAMTGLALGAHQIPVGVAGADPASKTLPDCNGITNALTFTQATDVVGCNAITAGAGAGAYPLLQGYVRYPRMPFNVQLTASTTVSNTSSATTIVGKTFSGKSTVPANTVKPGQSIRIKATGTVSITATPTLTLTVLLGGVTIATIVPTLSGVTTNNVWDLEYNFTVTSLVGVSGGGCFKYVGTAGAITGGCATGSTTGLNFATDQALDVQATWNTVSMSDTLTTNSLVAQLGS